MQRLSRNLINTAIRAPMVAGVRVGSNPSVAFPSSFALRAFSTKGPVNPITDKLINANGVVPEPTVARRTIDEIVKSIDTTLTPEQQEYVNSLKKKMRGGDRSRRCEFFPLHLTSLDCSESFLFNL